MSTKNIKHIKTKHNKSMQDINKRDREKEQSQTQGTCFEVRAPLLYIPAFDTRWISTMHDPNGSLLGAATHTSPRTL